MSDVTKKQFIRGSLWKILEQFSAKGISMVVSIMLARLLAPEDYGLLALTAIFTQLSDILIDGGFSTALIRKEKIDDADYGAVFSISSSISLALYIALFVAAPFISAYYVEPELTPVLRVMGLCFFVQAFTVVRNGIINRNMQFKLLFVCNAISSIVSGIIGIVTAYIGFGVWALVIQRMLQQILLTVMLFIKVKWKVSWRFNFKRIRQMLSFSVGVVGSSLLNYVGGSLYSVVIGKRYSVTDLGYYEKGGQLPRQLSLYTFGAMSSVLLPTISSCQSDVDRVRHIVRKVVSMTAFLIIPLMVGMAATTREIICLLFTPKWLPAEFIMQSMCLYYLATPFMLINVQVFFAMGKSELRVKTEIIRLIMMMLSLFVLAFAFDASINVLALSSALVEVLTMLIAFLEAKKLIGYSVVEAISDVWKALFAATVMFAVLFLISGCLPADNMLLSLIIKTFVGGGVYLICSLVLKSTELTEVLNLLRRKSNG